MNSVINTNQRYVSVSRPRRFGKTMAADMICAYYDRTADSREIFENRKIATNSDECVSPWDINLNKYDTIRLVMTDFIKTDVDTAFIQIKKRNYTERLEHYKDNILLIGINYDKNVLNKDGRFKHHSCKIEHA